MKLLFWKDNSKIDFFAQYLADDFYSHVQPEVAQEFIDGMPRDKKKKRRQVEQKVNAVIGAIQQFEKEQSLGLYGKARLQRSFNNRLLELGYDSAVTREVSEMILLGKARGGAA